MLTPALPSICIFLLKDHNVSAVETQQGVQAALTFFEWYFGENAMLDKESTTWRIILKDRRIINLSVCRHISN